MPQFTFTFLDAKGNPTTGRLMAPDRDTALQKASERCGTVVRLDEVVVPPGLLKRQVSTAEIMVTTQELAAMLRAGLPLLRALDVIAADAQTPTMRAVLAEVHLSVSEGSSLSQAMGRHPNAFSRLYVQMVEAGEAGAGTPEILGRLAGYIQRAEVLRQRMLASLYYPATVFVVSMVIGIFVLAFGVRQFQDIYSQLNAPMPAPTRLLLSLADLLWRFGGLLALVGLAAGWTVRRYLRTERGSLWLADVMLGLPMVGSLVRRVSIARFAHTLATLYACGVPILRALDLVAGAVGNRVLEAAVRRALEGVREGQSIVGPLRSSGVFTEMAISMIAAGEESGTLESMLTELANFYEEQAEIGLKALVAMVEPAAILSVGLVVGVVIVSLGLPLMGVVQVLN